MRRMAAYLLMFVFVLSITGCVEREVKNEETGEVIGYSVDPDHDHTGSYGEGVYLYPDLNVYEIRVQVEEVDSLTRQVAPASGSAVGVNGFASASFTGALIDGKSILRVLILESNSELAPPNSVTVIKVVDTKSTVLEPGDIVTFRCRHQEELLAPVIKSEKPVDRSAVSTWELDGCRMSAPAVQSTRPVPTR